MTDSDQHLPGQQVIDELDDFVECLVDGFHLALPHQDALGNKGAAGTRPRVDANHQHLGWRMDLTSLEPG